MQGSFLATISFLVVMAVYSANACGGGSSGGNNGELNIPGGDGTYVAPDLDRDIPKTKPAKRETFVLLFGISPRSGYDIATV